MLADIGGAGENLMDLRQAPASTVSGEDAAFVEMAGDGLDTIRYALGRWTGLTRFLDELPDAHVERETTMTGGASLWRAAVGESDPFVHLAPGAGRGLAARGGAGGSRSTPSKAGLAIRPSVARRAPIWRWATGCSTTSSAWDRAEPRGQ